MELFLGLKSEAHFFESQSAPGICHALLCLRIFATPSPCFKYTFSVFMAESVLSLGFLLKCHVPRGLLAISETICTAISDVINLFTFHISHRNLLIYMLIDFHLFPQPNYTLNEFSNLVCVLAVSCTCRHSTVASCFLLV